MKPDDLVSSLDEQYEKLKEHEKEKQQFMEDLLHQVSHLRSTLQDTDGDLARERLFSKDLTKRLSALEHDLREKDQEMNRNAFVLVLIDGDCMPFKDEYISRLGASRAAQRLRVLVENYIRSNLPTVAKLQSVEKIVRIYVNMKGMVGAYHDLGKGNDSATSSFPLDSGQFQSFVQEFNSTDPLFEFIDAGRGKECADTKIRENFKLNIHNLHCKHIFIGGSADNGYARLLKPYSSNEETCERVTMLEGPPFARELAELKPMFKTLAGHDVFRASKLSVRRVSFSTSSTPPPPSKSPKISGANDSISYAATAAQSNGSPPWSTVKRTEISSHTPTDERIGGTNQPKAGGHMGSIIVCNVKGERLDPPLEPCSQSLINALKARKLCNMYHLLGRCPYPSCTFEHGGPLSEKSLQALRYVARLAPCHQALSCSDEDCIAGHRCPANSGTCDRGFDCKFWRMHGVDLKPAKGL